MHLRQHTLSRWLLQALAAVIALAMAPTQVLDGQTTRPTAVPVLQDLHRVEELREMFNRDAGKVRIVLLLSPT